MSRTYRRKEGIGPGYQDKKDYCSQKVVYEGRWPKWVDIDPGSEEYAELSAKYHSDSGTHNFKEPGPRWFRNLYTNRPLRRDSDREILKWMKNDGYEPMIDTKGKRPYWT